MATDVSSGVRIRATLVSIVLVVLLLGGGFACFEALASLKKKPDRGSKAPPRTAVRVLEARRTTYIERVRGYGRVRALRTAEVAAEVSGLVARVDPRLEAGQEVDAGQALVVIDDRDLEQAFANAKAVVEQREASADTSRKTIKNLNKLLAVAREEQKVSGRRLKSMLELEQTSSSARDEVDAQRLRTAASRRVLLRLEEQISATSGTVVLLEAEIRAAKANRTRAKNDLERAVIKAPYAGTIVSRSVALGMRVGPGTPLFRIVDLSRVEIPVKLGASRFADIRPGAEASIRLTEDGDDIWRGKVARIAPVVDTEARTFEVYLDLGREETHGLLPPGAFVAAEIEGRSWSGVIPLPRTAMLGDAVFVVKRDPENPSEGVVRRCIPTLARLLTEIVLVADGIQPGDMVVLTSLEKLADGMRVILVKDADEPVRTNGKSGR